MKNKKEKPDILTIKIGRTNYRALVIAFICSVAFMLFITVGSMTLFKMQISDDSIIEENLKYTKYSKHYVMITGSGKTSFWEGAYQAALKTANENDAYLEVLGNNLSVDYSEKELMRIAIDSKVDGIIVEAHENRGMRDLIDEAVKAGIPVVTVIGDCASSSRQSYIGISSYDLGSEYGEQVCSIVDNYYRIGSNIRSTTVKPTKKVLVLMNEGMDNTSQNIVYTSIGETIERETENADKVQLESKTISNEVAFAAEESIRDILLDKENQPDIIICLDELSTTCVYQAVVDYNKVGQIDIIGYYDSSTILHAILQKVIYSTIFVDTAQLGEYCINALEEYKESGYVSEYYSADIFLISSSNVKKYLEEENNAAKE
ncbi:MAG TPA: substrate-binding domain-containing protein [Lachnospiraceae bacterium]|nr:substrate-binding domain-containing protein [Lachnospiraceae bacterium]